MWTPAYRQCCLQPVWMLLTQPVGGSKRTCKTCLNREGKEMKDFLRSGSNRNGKELPRARPHHIRSTQLREADIVRKLHQSAAPTPAAKPPPSEPAAGRRPPPTQHETGESTERRADDMGDVAVAAGGLSSPPTPPPPELSMVARAMERLVARNDALLLLLDAEQGGGEGITGMSAFEGTGPPRIGVAQYLERVHRYAALEPECYVVAYAYVDRAAHRRPAAAVASGNVHRLLLACLLVASKVLDDFHHDNAFFARVGGVSNAEMNKLELELLGVLDFEVMLSRRLYDLYRAHLHKQQADDHHDTSDKPDQEPSRVDGGEEDHDDDRITRLPEGVLRYDWSQQAPATNGGRRHSSSQAPSRYS